MRPGRQKLLALSLVASALVATGGYFLASSGAVGLTIAVAPGTPTAGGQTVFATMTPIGATVTGIGGSGAAVSNAFPLARVATSYQDISTLKISIYWLNPTAAAAYLKMGYLSVGAYETVHTGTCVNGGAGGKKHGKTQTAKYTYATFTTPTSPATTYCAVLLPSTGTAVNSDGRVFLSRSMLGTHFFPTVTNGAKTLTKCTAVSTASAAETSKTPCQPSSVTTASTNAVYVLATAMNHGGNAPGETTTTISPLKFTIIAQRK